MIRISLKIGLALVLCVFIVAKVNGQSRCSDACANNAQCASGACTLSSCVDFVNCYQFCLSCNGQDTCYGSGAGCNYTNLLIQVSSGPATVNLQQPIIFL